jgi:hypothetical protein
MAEIYGDANIGAGFSIKIDPNVLGPGAHVIRFAAVLARASATRSARATLD